MYLHFVFSLQNGSCTHVEPYRSTHKVRTTSPVVVDIRPREVREWANGRHTRTIEMAARKIKRKHFVTRWPSISLWAWVREMMPDESKLLEGDGKQGYQASWGMGNYPCIPGRFPVQHNRTTVTRGRSLIRNGRCRLRLTFLCRC